MHFAGVGNDVQATKFFLELKERNPDIIFTTQDKNLIEQYFKGLDFKSFVFIGLAGMSNDITGDMLFYLFKQLDQKVAIITQKEAKVFVGNKKCMSSSYASSNQNTMINTQQNNKHISDENTTVYILEFLKHLKLAQKYGVKYIILDVNSMVLSKLNRVGVKFDSMVFDKYLPDFDFKYLKHKGAVFVNQSDMLQVQKDLADFKQHYENSKNNKSSKYKRINITVFRYGNCVDKDLKKEKDMLCFNNYKVAVKGKRIGQLADFVVNISKKSLVYKKQFIPVFGTHNTYNFMRAMQSFIHTLAKRIPVQINDLVDFVFNEIRTYKLPTGHMQILSLRPLVLLETDFRLQNIANDLIALNEVEKFTRIYRDQEIMVVLDRASLRSFGITKKQVESLIRKLAFNVKLKSVHFVESLEDIVAELPDKSREKNVDKVGPNKQLLVLVLSTNL